MGNRDRNRDQNRDLPGGLFGSASASLRTPTPSHVLVEPQVRHLPINDSVTKLDAVCVRFFLRWVS